MFLAALNHANLFFWKKIIIDAQSAWPIKPGQEHQKHSTPTIAFP
jgi:hypothetical protein